MSQNVISTRTANALISDAKARVKLPHTGVTLGALRLLFGGAWVGGRAVLTTESLNFSPNAMNRAVTSGSLDVSLPLGEIATVADWGIRVYGVVSIASPTYNLRLICIQSSSFAQQIRSAASI